MCEGTVCHLVMILQCLSVVHVFWSNIADIGLLAGVPNLIFTMGYAAASWTLRAEATCTYWVRLLNHM